MTVRTSAKSTLISAGTHNQVGDALHGAQQHVVGGAERLIMVALRPSTVISFRWEW